MSVVRCRLVESIRPDGTAARMIQRPTVDQSGISVSRAKGGAKAVTLGIKKAERVTSAISAR